MKWFKENADLIKVVTIVAAMVIWLYDTFGTIGMIKSAEANMLLYVDEKHSGVDERLDILDKKLDKLGDLSIQIIREMKK